MTSSRYDRPPAGLAVAAFFESWLPQAFAASGRHAPDAAPRVRATLTAAAGGDPGGAWEMTAEEDRLVVGPPDSAPPDVWLRQSVVDFRAAFDGDPDLPTLLAPRWSALDLLFLDPRDVDLLRQVSGRILLEVTGKRARRWALDVAFGKTGVAAGRPRTTIRLDGATFEGLSSGALPPMQPLLDGRLAIEGDKALAMQLLLLLGSRLGRR